MNGRTAASGGAARRKLELPRRSVNLTRATGLLALAALGALAGGCAVRREPLPRDIPTLEWPTYLGNLRRAGYADERVPDSVEVAWRAHPGRGLLAPVLLAPPMVFATTEGRIVEALAADQGAVYWARRVEDSMTGGAVAGGGRLYAATSDAEGYAYAIRIGNGGVAWKRGMGGVSRPPLLVHDTLFLASDRAGVHALAAATGAVLWRTKVPAAAESTPVPFGEIIAVAARNDSIYALRRADGRVVARRPLGGGAAAPPALSGDTLFVPLHTAELLALRLPGLDTLFRVRTPQPVEAAPIVAPDGGVYLLDRAAAVWRIPPGEAAVERVVALDGAARASLTLGRDRLLVGRLDGTLFALRLDGSIVWRRRFDESIVAPVSLAGGAVYVPLIGGTVVKLRDAAAGARASAQPTSYNFSRSP
ncbi:MAG: PQQ-binding-like beta-propeller repeat protein [Gemmatimonadetes bacterium]|nr:PQQ-binding-like beta-propeller repeat protein [Gemmatimonadota bacterium]